MLSSVTLRLICVLISIFGGVFFNSHAIGNVRTESHPLERFYRQNPREIRQQFKGVKINIMYSCVSGRSTPQNNVCGSIKNIVKKLSVVNLIQVDFRNVEAINFVVKEAGYDGAAHQGDSYRCSIVPQERSVILHYKMRIDNLKDCLYKSTLWHLGFDLSGFSEFQIGAAEFSEIIFHYTEY